MKLNNVFSFSHLGNREYQEDCFSFSNDYLLVADGVGGLAKGEVASKIVVSVVKDSFNSLDYLEQTNYWVDRLVLKILDTLFETSKQQPYTIGMGSTMALFGHLNGSFFSAHIGDSRIYVFEKSGSIRWKSKDHSLVQELMTAGVITEEQAKTHPRKNVITRVLQAKESKDVKASLYIFSELLPGDRILVCSDGVTESWTDNSLTSLFSLSVDNQEVIDLLSNKCKENSIDNNTALIATIC